MKVIDPKVSIIMTVHKKPTIHRAIESVLAQTSMEFELVILDSGWWLDQEGEVADSIRDAYRKYAHNPLIVWYLTGEPKKARSLYCPVSHWFNKAYQLGLIRGKYFCTFYDDDVYMPEFIEKMSNYLDNSDKLVVRCSQKRLQDHANNTTETPPLQAISEIPQGGQVDCIVDGGQVMFKTEILKPLADLYNNEIMPDNPNTEACSHQDGVFLTRVINYAIGGMGAIDEILMEHHSTLYSTFTPTV